MSLAAVVPGRTRSVRAFAAVAAISVLFMAASSAPSPLYVVYQQQWGFSATVLTVVFAIYVVGLLGSLLVVGALSDHVGRRPVLGAAILLESVSLVLFLTAGDVTVLGVARFLQGVATGAAITALGATLVDLNPPHKPGLAGLVNGITPTVGLALGSLGCGALVEYAPAPTRLVYVVLLAGMVLSGVVVLALRESSARRPGALASLRPRVGIPPRLRAQVMVVVPVLLASWALGGLYLSLGPSVAAELFGLHSHLVGGIVVSLLCATGAVASFLARRRPAERLLAPAALLLAAGTLITLVAAAGGMAVLAAAGTVVAGVGFGMSALACFGTFARIAAPHERGELLAVAYVISYLAFSVPAVAAGLASNLAGLRVTVEVYGLVVVVLAASAALARQVLARREAARSPECVAVPE
ncbi:MFS transporter [Goodfellowiella coeruleoviolacea]|uniref:Arabinose efflux permease, MFS family n=1 Tax=Goodfellowiella coeruleoviolacea TaxID=334858 RepID=A0AAE3KEW2_9PSEU|nr:MFS transporter [Goodfellowiella coeruleoviolacea]MCP2163819.1 putative arabinose efflux permease, MFS family [Goodfellowiella coeruleoviolacea]